jgi:hypothetical protein
MTDRYTRNHDGTYLRLTDNGPEPVQLARNKTTGEYGFRAQDGSLAPVQLVRNKSTGAVALSVGGAFVPAPDSLQSQSPAPAGGLLQAATPFTQGGTVGFGDEISGEMAAGMRAGINKGRDLLGLPIQQTADEARQNTKGLFRETLQDEREQRPIASAAGEITGGILSPVARVAKIGSVAGGAILGGAYGFGSDEGGFADRLDGLGVGAVFGGIGGKLGDKLGQFFGKRFTQGGRRAVNAPGQAADDAAEFGIDLTVGQATDDISRASFENAAATGARGPGAKDTLRPFFQEQATRARAAGRSLTSETVDTLNDAGTVIGEGVKNARNAAKQAVDDAYSQARSYNAALRADAIPDLVDAVDGGLSDDVAAYFTQAPQEAATAFPNASQARAAVQRLTTELAENTTKNQKPVALDFQRIERTRSLVTRLANDAKPEDGRQVRQLRSALDGWLDSAVEEGLFEGDPAFIRAYQRARGLRTKYGQQFERGRETIPGEKVLAKIVERDANEVQTINYLLGAGKAKFGDASARAAQTMKKVLGANSPEFAALKEAAVMKLMRGDGGGRDRLGAQGLFSAWDDALNGSGAPVMKELFDPSEIAFMRKYASVVKSLVPPSQSVNYSASGLENARRRFDKVLNAAPAGMASIFRRANNFLGGVATDNNSRLALESVGRIPRGQVAAPASATAGGALTAQQTILPASGSQQ